MSTIVYGCSITHGRGLDSPLDAWPHLLFDNFVDRSRPGASNKEIWYKIRQQTFDKNDTVIIQWSFVNRSCVIHSDHTLDPLDCWGDDSYNKDWVNFIARNSNIYDLAVNSLAYIESIDRQLKNTCRIFHLVIDERLCRVMDTVDFIDISQAIKTDVGNDGLHPGKLSHQIIADLMRQSLYE